MGSSRNVYLWLQSKNEFPLPSLTDGHHAAGRHLEKLLHIRNAPIKKNKTKQKTDVNDQIGFFFTGGGGGYIWA